MMENARGTESAAGADGDWPLGRDCSNNLDFLRFLLATIVILSHSWPLLLGKDVAARLEPGFLLTGGQIEAGSMAVNGFFAISGFLIVRSWEQCRGRLGEFLGKRARRIYPGYIAAVLFCWLVVGWPAATDPGSYWFNLDLWAFLRQTTLLELINIPNSFPHAPTYHELNGATWTVRFEAVSYLLAALWGLAGLCRRPRLALIPLAIYGTLYVLQVRHYLPAADGLNGEFLGDFFPAIWHGNWPRFLFCFWAGAALYLNRQFVPRRGKLALLALLVLVILRVWHENLLPFLPVCGTYLLFYVAFLPVPRLARFAKHGDFSYGMYLYAWPVQELWVMYAGRHLQPLTLFALAFATTLPFAVLSWHLIEKRFLRRAARPEPAARPTLRQAAATAPLRLSPAAAPKPE